MPGHKDEIEHAQSAAVSRRASSRPSSVQEGGSNSSSSSRDVVPATHRPAPAETAQAGAGRPRLDTRDWTMERCSLQQQKSVWTVLEILEELGGGAYGTVYKARDIQRDVRQSWSLKITRRSERRHTSVDTAINIHARGRIHLPSISRHVKETTNRRS